MSTSKNKNIFTGTDFTEVWERLVSETDIKYLKDLGKLVGVTQQNVSSRKQENLFPYGWAYPIAKKYGLLTEWIISGNGPKRLSDLKNKTDLDFAILEDLNDWLTEMVKEEPYRKDWFQGNLEDAFPLFKEWLKRKEEMQSDKPVFPDSKVA